MEAHSRMRLGREAPVNSFLLCTVLAKQTRRLGRLMPDRGIPELITIAMKNCADYELALELGPGVPGVVRDKAMQIGRITRRAEPSVASSPGHSEQSWFRDAVSAAAQPAGDREPTGDASLPGKSSMGAQLFVGGSVNASDLRRDLSGVRRKHSMSNSHGVDLTRLRQLQAMAENLCTLANRHRENHNYVLAHALYGRALTIAQEIHTPENDGNSLVTRIRADQQAVFEMLRSVESSPEKPPLEKAKEVGR
ncbi:MAG: hypothetical protein WB952_10585 [Terriglobales bacterium]